MTTIEITGGAVAAVITAGAYLRWAVKPAVVAYRVGRGVERLVANPTRYGIGRRGRKR